MLTLPNPDLFVFMYVRKEAVLSSQIEGTQSSLQDLLSAEARLFDQNLPSDVAEVINYVRAMNHGLAQLPELPVSVRLIREIHAELMRGVRGGRLQPGELRTSQNWSGPTGCTLDTASYVPPPPHVVPEALGDLVFGKVGGGAEWSSGRRRVSLNPLNTFEVHGEASVYVQVRGIARDASYRAVFEFFDGDDADAAPRLTLSFTEQSPGGIQELQRTLGLGQLTPGGYRVRLTVTAAGGSATSEGWVTIVK